MSLKNTSSSYGTVAKTFHWLIVIAVYTMIAVGFIMGNVSDDALAGKLYDYHNAFGLTILAIVLLRFSWRQLNNRPTLPESVPTWQRIASSAVHYGLYLVLICMLLSGWLMSSAAGYNPSFFGLFQVPALLNENKALAKTFAEIHEILAFTLIALIVVHVGAALKHYFIDKDKVLQRMLPGTWE